MAWTYNDWKHVIFSDEAKFDVCVGDNRKRVIRTKKEAFHTDCLKRTVKFAKGQMVWGCMSAAGVGALQLIQGTVNANKYQDILQTSLLPSIERLCPDGNCIFQQDGASSHTARTTKAWLGNNNINVLSWPSNSPDLNVIENVWHEMKKHLRNRPQRTIADLRNAIQHIWDTLTPEFCRKLVESMPARIRAVIKAKGDVTSY